MANENWWDKYATGATAAAPEEEEPVAEQPTEGNWWDKYATPTPEVEEPQESAIPTVSAEGGNWWDKYAEPEPAAAVEDPDKALVSSWEKTTEEFDGLRSNYERLGQRYQELGAMETRTPEQEQELQKAWNDLLGSELDLQSSLKKVQDLQPQVDDYYNRQKQNRIDYIEERRGSAIFGDAVADALYDIDARSEAEYAEARQIPEKDQRKKALADIQAKYQAEEKQLLQSSVDAFKEGETKINNAAEVINQASASGKTLDRFLLEDMANVPEYAELRDSFINQDDPEKGRLFREAMTLIELANGQKRKEGEPDTWKLGGMGDDGTTEAARVGIVNGEIRISPIHVWDRRTIEEEISGLDIGESQKRQAIASIPKMQEEAAKVELPFLQKVNEFNDFVKENGLEGASPQEQIAQWKGRNRNWTEYITKAPAQVGLGLAQGSLGLLEAGQAIIGATALTMGADKFADPFLDAASQTSEKIQEFNRIAQEIGGPTILGELAAVAPQIALQIGVGGAVGFGGRKLGFQPKTVSNLGFGSSVGTALAQSYGGVLSSSIQQLEKEKIDSGMDPVQARAEAVKESQLPAALSGLSTAVITIIGGKRGVEAPFRGNLDDIKAKLNTAAFRAELPKLAPNVFKGMSNEGLEEFFDQLAQGIIEQFSFNPDLSTTDLVNNAFKALLIGGITGGSVEGLKYGFDYIKAPKEMARRKDSMASIRESISSIEEEIAQSSASSPIGAEFQREYNMTSPSQEAANLGGVAIDRNRMTALQAERQQLQELLEDETLSRVARNELEAKLAVADYNYYSDILVQGRANILTEQIVDESESRAISSRTRDAVSALTKIANGRGAGSLTGRERVAVGITAIGEGRFLPSKKNPMVEVNDQGVATVTEAGRLMAENIGILPLVRMIGISEQLKAKRAELERVRAAIAEEAEKQKAKDAAESEEAKKYGPASAEALKQQVNNLPPTPENIDERVAQLLREEEEAKLEAEKVFEAEIDNRIVESFRQNLREYLTPTETTAPQIDLDTFRNYLDSIAPQIEANTFDIKTLDQGVFKNLLPDDAYNVIVEAFREDPKRALKALRAFGDEIENAIKEFGGGGAGAAEETPEVASLRRIVRTEQTPEDVDSLTKAGLVEVYNGQPVITQAGLDMLPEADRPRLTPEARKIQIDTGASDVVAEAISKNLRIGVDQVGPNVTMPEGWTLEGDIYVPPQKKEVVKAEEPPVSELPLVSELPPVQEGFVRLYHGGANKTAGEFTPDLQYALGYARQSKGSIFYVDVPEDSEFLVRGNYDERGNISDRGMLTARQNRVPDDIAFTAKRAASGFEEQPVTPPVAPPAELPPAPDVAKQAKKAVADAKKARAKMPPANITVDRSRSIPRALTLRPNDTIGKTVREALRFASRINISKIAKEFPNEVLLQDVAAILAELDLPALDNENIIKLAPRYRGRARRFFGGDIGLPASVKEQISVLVHEAGHTLTADQVRQYAPRGGGSGRAYIEALKATINNPTTPPPVARLFSLYISTLEQLGIMGQYGKFNGLAGTTKADTSRSRARKLQAKGQLRGDLDWDQLYALANVEEFVSQTFSSKTFRDLLKTLKDPTNPQRTAWQAFVDAIKNILSIPDGTMAAAVIEASVDIAMEVPSTRTVQQRGAAPAPTIIAEYPSIGININDAAQNFTEQILSGEKTIETRATDSLRPYVGRRVGIVRTGVGPAELVGYATIGEPIVYNNVKEFRADQEKHLVEAGSEFDIQEGGVKYGYPLTDVESVTPTPVTSQGIIARKIPQPEVIEGDIWQAPEQEITSARTSINERKLPAVFNKVKEWVSGTINADIGGGRFDNATNWLQERGVTNLIIDWFNRDRAFNEANIERVRGGQADTATVSNVLNVIQEQSARDLVIRQAADAIKEDGTAYFYIYEGDQSGTGKQTTSGWQENRRTQDYIEEISVYFGDVTRQGQMVVAKSPIKEEGDMAPEGEPEEGTMEMSLEMDKERVFKLLGERLYTSDLSKVVTKETVQNGFDAIKDAEEAGEIPRGSGVITYSRKDVNIDGEDKVRVVFMDNGSGMTPDILQKAFFTVGGTFKRSGKGSGGFGLAKLGMFMSADRIVVETVRNGVVSEADLTRQKLVDKKFDVKVSQDPNRPNGTMVILDFKEKLTKSDGSVVEFTNPYTKFDQMIRHNLTVVTDNYGSYQDELISLFRGKTGGLWTFEEIKDKNNVQTYTIDDLAKAMPNVRVIEKEFPVAGATKPIKVKIVASRLGMKGKDGKQKVSESVNINGTNRTIYNSMYSVYSNGLFQFSKENIKLKPMEGWFGPIFPYHLAIDVDAGGIDASSTEYPFTNNREGFQKGAIADFVNEAINSLRTEEIARQFDTEFSLLTDINGGKPQKNAPTLYNNTTIDIQPFEQKFLQDLSTAIFDVADDMVVKLRDGYDDGMLEDEWYKVKSQKDNAPMQGKADEDSLDYFYGVGISKNWGGVNTSREPVSVLVNPIYSKLVESQARTAFGRELIAEEIVKTLIHEINHHLHRNEGSDFTYFLLQNEAYLNRTGQIQAAYDRILPIVNQYQDAIISLRNKFLTAETKDNDNELTGEQYERASKEANGQPKAVVVGGNRVIQQPSAEVSPRPTSEEDGEQTGAYLPSSLTNADRQDAGIGAGIAFGEVLADLVNRGEITPTGEIVPQAAPTAEGEFVIRPEDVVPPIGGTSEAATLKVMENAMKLGNEQSAKLGTPEGTLPLETIVTAWMNSNMDPSVLENAIIRYTNLSDQAAANFAQAFAKQYKIQKGLSSLASAKKAEPEERVGTYSFAERVIAADELPADVRDKVSRAYQVLRNEVSAEEADRVLSNLTIGEAINAVKDLGNGISFPVRSMMAQIIERRILNDRNNLKRKGDKAKYDQAVDVHVDFFNWISDYSKELGQGVQAFAQWINLGPDGIVRKLRRDTERIIDENIKGRRKKIDKIKQDIEEGDNKSFNEATTRNKKSIEDLGDKAGKEEAKRVTIEDQAQKIAQRLAKRVEGKAEKRKPDPLSDLVNGHIRKLNPNFVQEAIALGISPETANKIDESAKKLDQDRKAAKDQREAFRKAQEAREKVSRDLARENKYIYGERPTIWEDYQEMFAERFARALLRDPKKKPPPALLLFTNRLTQNLVGFIPETQRQKATPQSFQAFIEDALNNKERYAEAFNAAMEQISLRIEELEARMGGGEMAGAEFKKTVAAHEFMEKLAPLIEDFPVSEKLVNRFVNQKAKALNISLAGAYNQWYRADRRTRQDMEKSLSNALLQNVNIDSTDADRLAKLIVKDFKQKAEERRKKALERFKAPKQKIKPDRAARTDKLQRFFELVNMGALSDRDAYEIFAERFQLPVYDEDFVAYVEETAQRIQGMEDNLARRLKTQELMSEIARNRGFDPADIGAGFVYANILSSPDTHMVNILDTAINNFANGLADAIATGDLARLRGIVNGYRKGIFEAAEVWKTGKRINVPGFEEKAPLILELLRFGEADGIKLTSLEGANAIIKALLESKPSYVLNAAKYVGRLLEAQDALNFSASAEGERYARASRIAAEEGLTGDAARKRMNEILNLEDGAYQAALVQAEKEGYTGAEAKFRAMEIQDKKIPKEIKEAGFERGLRDVYRNMPVGVAGLLSDKLTNALMSISNPLVRNVARLTVSPFVITPINLFNKWLDWSPWGYKRMFFGTGNWAGGKYYVEPFEKGSAERRAQMLKASSSILVTTVLWAMVRAGIATIHGRGPSDEEERKQWSDDNNKPYTIQFGNGPALSFAYTPWALMLSWMANVENYYKYNAKEEPDDQSALWRMAAAVAMVPTILEELPFYQGVNDIFKTASAIGQRDFEKAYTDFFEPKVAMLFPNLFRYFDRLFDPTVYNTDGAKALLIDQIPFARRLGGQRMNMFGEPIGEGKKFYEQLATRFVNFPKPSRESRILAVYDAYPYIPNPKRAKALVDGEPAQMTPQQYDKFIRGMGQEFKQYLLDNFDPDVELTPEEQERGKKRISERMEKIRARWVREVSTY